MNALSHLAARVKRLRLGDTFVRRNPFVYPGALRLFDHLEGSSLDERVAWTERRLSAVLAAARGAAYGRSLPVTERVGDWPVLEKEQIRDTPQALRRGRPWVSSPATTSGTTGLPMELWRSFRSLAVEQAAIDRLLIRQGINPRNYRAAILRGDDIKRPTDQSPPFWELVGGGRRLIFSSNHLNARTIDAFAGALDEFRPDVLHAYPTVLESFCLLLRSVVGRQIRIPLTICSSEVLSDQTWDLALAALDTVLLDYYGQAERVAFAYAFEPGAYLLLPGYSHNELVLYDREEDADLYELIATGLWNLKMPLVRLRTGDLLRVPRGGDLERVRWGVEPFDGIVGRSGDYLIGPDGDRLVGIDHIPRGVSNVVRMQVIQERPDYVRLLVLPGAGFSTQDRAALIANAAKKLPSTMRVTVETTTELERTSGNKAPFVIRRI
jgi:phenylacetate-CoA ligase